MARDLSKNPWRSAIVAPLFTPLAMLLVAFLTGTWKREPLRPIRLYLDDIGGVLVVWVLAYLYMFLLAMPAMLLTRRWIAWTSFRLIVLGAFLAALPWIPYWKNVLVVSLVGALVASAYCLLQLYAFRPPSPDSLG